MAEENRDRLYMVKLNTKEHGLLQGMVDKCLFDRLQAKDSVAISLFISAILGSTNTDKSVDEIGESVPAESVPADSVETVTKPEGKWHAQKEEALMQAYSDVTHKDAKWSWAKVAWQFEANYKEKITAESARLKIRSLKEKFRRLEQHNNTSGNDPVDVPEIMATTFGPENAVEVKTLESLPTQDTTDDPMPNASDNNLDNAVADESPRGKIRKRGHASERQTGAQIVMKELRLLRHEDREIQAEQFERKCQLATDMISAIKSLKRD